MTTCRVCATVTGASLDDLRRGRDEAIRADLVELRLDGLQAPEPFGALQGRQRPVVVTCRPRWEGGRFGGGEDERLCLLRAALDEGAEYVDVEWDAPFRDELLALAASRIVLSFHDFDGIPADLASRLRAMHATGAAMVKAAVWTERLSDLETLAAVGRPYGGDRRLVLVGMGDAGAATRILPGRFGSAWTYGGAGVASGQLPLERLLDEFRVREHGPDTAVYGVIGREVRHSLSPAMHNAAFDATGTDAVYLPLEAAALDDVVRAREVLGLTGCSVTAPHKLAAARAAATTDQLVARLGAANTLRWSQAGTGWEAINTDVEGFLAPLAHEVIRGVRATVVGGGGAARAVVAGLVDRGARVTVRTRDRDSSRAWVEAVGAELEGLPVPGGSWDLLVNATPVGGPANRAASPVAEDALDGRIVYDLVYNPPMTKLLQAAARRGCTLIGGLDMLVAQGARQFEWWTGRSAPLDRMREAAARRLEVMAHEEAERAQELHAP